MPETIDVVYTWVDGDSPQYRETKAHFAPTPADLNPERYRDNLDLLKYSLRSLAKHAPWVGKIFVVTMRPQVPSWLNTNHPKIAVVHHDEFFADLKNLPTFSSNAIELQIHRIRNLSENFLYVCDDMLLGRSVELSDFKTHDGKTLVMPRRFGNEHLPHLVNIRYFQAMVGESSAYYDRTVAARFRDSNTFPIDHLYADYLLSLGLATPYDESFARENKRHLPLGLFDLERTQATLRKIARVRPKFICFSDDLGDEPDARYLELARAFLEEFFPAKSDLELA